MESQANSGQWSLSIAFIFSLLILVLMGSFFAYYQMTESLTVDNEVAGPSFVSLVFWAALTFLLIYFTLRKSCKIAYNAVRKSKWFLMLFPVYLLVHLVIYGVLLESILIGAYGGVPSYGAFGTVVTGSFSFSPHSLFSVLLSLTVSPSISVLIPPYFSATVSPFAIFAAVPIAILVVANISIFMQMRLRLKRVAGSVAVPLVGVVLGAGCCLSIPELVAIASPALSGLLFTPLGLLAQDVLYYLLPLTVIAILALNLESIAGLNLLQSSL